MKAKAAEKEEAERQHVITIRIEAKVQREIQKKQARELATIKRIARLRHEADGLMPELFEARVEKYMAVLEAKSQQSSEELDNTEKVIEGLREQI